MALTVAICGDSAMWGQGLTRDHTYAFLAADEIARLAGEPLVILAGRGQEPLRGEARSGAKTRPFVADVGGVGDAERFIETFPDLFGSEDERRRFRSGTDESPAAQLFGENPAPFPTVTDAVKHYNTPTGAAAEIVLLNGGVNDIDFEDILDPDGPDLRRMQTKIKDAFNNRLGQLLDDARTSFPNALIIYVGYYSVFSSETDREQIKRLGKYKSDKPQFLITLNDIIQEYDPGPGKVLWNAIGGKDLDRLSKAAVRRSVVAAATAQFWIQFTIATLSSRVRGPGVVYAHPGLRPENAAWAGRRSMVYDRYRQPGEGGKEVNDEMLPTRLANIPRRVSLPVYQRAMQAFARAVLDLADGGGLAAKTRREFEASAAAIAAEPGMTPKMTDAANSVVAGFTFARAEKLIRLVETEFARIEHATFASFLHPNPRGARRFANRVVTASQRHRNFALREAMEPAGSGVGVGRELRRHGVDTTTGLRRLAPIAEITSLAVQFEGLQNNHSPASLLLNGVEIARIGPRDSGSKNLFVAAEVELSLVELDELRLKPLAALLGKQMPRADFTRVFLNGRPTLSIAAKDLRKVGDDTVIWAGTP